VTEHPAEPAQWLPDHFEGLRCVTLPAIPTVYGLDDPEEGVTKWVVALPGGRAYIIPLEEDGSLIHTSLELVVRRWAPRKGADLVLVTT
jgi:hypothetical protein